MQCVGFSFVFVAGNRQATSKSMLSKGTWANQSPHACRPIETHCLDMRPTNSSLTKRWLGNGQLRPVRRHMRRQLDGQLHPITRWQRDMAKAATAPLGRNSRPDMGHSFCLPRMCAACIPSNTSVLHHVFLLLFMMFLSIIMIFGVILMHFLL